MPPTLRLAAIAEILALRSAVLRPGQPIGDSVYAIDELPGTLHAGAFVEERCVGCATVFSEALESCPAYRLRGMAVHPDYRSRGIGRALLAFILAELADRNVTLLWCNARLPAVRFYQSQGWTVAGPQFDIPAAGGAHHQMILRLGPKSVAGRGV